MIRMSNTPKNKFPAYPITKSERISSKFARIGKRSLEMRKIPKLTDFAKLHLLCQKQFKLMMIFIEMLSGVPGKRDLEK